MATDLTKEQDVECAKALNILNNVLAMKMDGLAVCHSLYNKKQLTYREYEKIRTCRNVPDANSELIAALHRRGPDILGILIEVLEEEKEANGHIIKAIKEGKLLIILAQLAGEVFLQSRLHACVIILFYSGAITIDLASAQLNMHLHFLVLASSSKVSIRKCPFHMYCACIHGLLYT